MKWRISFTLISNLKIGKQLVWKNKVNLNLLYQINLEKNIKVNEKEKRLNSPFHIISRT